MKRILARCSVMLIGALGTIALAAACSSFSAAAPTGEGGITEGGTGESSNDCVDTALSDDPQNCGRCGHSCLGGACATGICQPFVFATSDVNTVLDLRVDATRALWTTSSNAPWTESSAGQLFESPLTGMGHTPADASVTPILGHARVIGSLDVSTLGTFVSFLDDDEAVDSVTATAAIDFQSPGVRLHGIGQLLYFERFLATDYSIYAHDPDSGAPNGTNQASFGHRVFDFTVQGNTIIVVDGNVITACAPSAACAPIPQTISNTQPITAFAADETRIYWMSDGHSVTSCAVSMSSPSSTACSGVTTPLSIASDTILDIIVDHGALWAASSSSIYMCPLPAGCLPNPAPFVTSSNHLFDGTEYLNGHHFAASDAAFFWAESAPGVHQIMEVAR